jgi:hypothetical protein
MPILHIRLTSNRQVITLPTYINAQRMILKKVVIHKDISTASTIGSGLFIELPFINGFEMVSNSTAKQIVVPFNETIVFNDIEFNLDIEGEHIDQEFEINVHNTDLTTRTPFDVAGGLDSIDIYFSFTNDSKYF